MNLMRGFATLLILAGIVGLRRLDAQPPGDNTTTSARQLDALLQNYAYRAFIRPRTGKVYPVDVPENLSGVKLSVVRLRSGSLRLRGLQNFNEFDIPSGVIVSPYVVRLALVYQNLGNWSSKYYSLPGYSFLAPVIGLLAYSAANLSATNLPELDIEASLKPISIKFANRSLISRGQKGKCVYFSLNGSHELVDLVSGNLCTTSRQGHFSVAVEAQVPIEEHEKGKSNVWKIVVSVVAGVLGLVLLLLLMLLLLRHRRNKKMKNMINRSDEGEVLKEQRVGGARLPVASMIRTKPALENEYTP